MATAERPKGDVKLYDSKKDIADEVLLLIGAIYVVLKEMCFRWAVDM